MYATRFLNVYESMKQWRSQDLVSGGAQPDFPLLSSFFSHPSLPSHPPFSPLRTVSPSLCPAVFLCHPSPPPNSASESGAVLWAPSAGPAAKQCILCILRQNRSLSWHEHEVRCSYGLHFTVNWTYFMLFIVCKNFVVRFRWGPGPPAPPPPPVRCATGIKLIWWSEFWTLCFCYSLATWKTNRFPLRILRRTSVYLSKVIVDRITVT